MYIYIYELFMYLYIPGKCNKVYIFCIVEIPSILKIHKYLSVVTSDFLFSIYMTNPKSNTLAIFS